MPLLLLKVDTAYDNWIKTLENGEEKLKSIVSKIPLENRTHPEEIADTCLFTISEKSSHTTGQFICCGGYAFRPIFTYRVNRLFYFLLQMRSR